MNRRDRAPRSAGAPRRLTRLSEKQAYDVEALYALLDSVYVGHVAHADTTGAGATLGGVSVTPTVVIRDEDRLVWHGSTASRWMRLITSGTPVAISVAALDGLVVARSRFESSLQYRSAVVRGVPVVLDGDEKNRALDAVVERIVPGRGAETRESTAKELAATLVLAVPLDDWVLKVSDGWPEDTEEDVAKDVWAGVVPMATSYGSPLPAPDLRPGVVVPESVRRLR